MSVQEYTWKGKTLTGSFNVGEQVHLITQNLVTLDENGKFKLSPIATQINIIGGDGTHRHSIFLDEKWEQQKNNKEEQDQRIQEAKNKLLNTPVAVNRSNNAPVEGTPGAGAGAVTLGEGAGEGAGTPGAGTPGAGNVPDMFGGAGSFDLSSSIRKNNNVGLKYRKSRTARCVEKCMRNSRRKSQRRLRGKN